MAQPPAHFARNTDACVLHHMWLIAHSLSFCAHTALTRALTSAPIIWLHQNLLQPGWDACACCSNMEKLLGCMHASTGRPEVPLCDLRA